MKVRRLETAPCCGIKIKGFDFAARRIGAIERAPVGAERQPVGHRNARNHRRQHITIKPEPRPARCCAIRRKAVVKRPHPEPPLPVSMAFVERDMIGQRRRCAQGRARRCPNQNHTPHRTKRPAIRRPPYARIRQSVAASATHHARRFPDASDGVRAGVRNSPTTGIDPPQTISAIRPDGFWHHSARVTSVILHWLSLRVINDIHLVHYAMCGQGTS